MGYEVESFSSNHSNTPNPSPALMKEERVINPYQSRNPSPQPPQAQTSTPTPPPQNIGQGDIDKKVDSVEETKPTEETVKLSPQVAALARREQKFRLQQQEYQKEKAAIEAERSELAQLRAMKQKLDAKDYSALDGVLDYNDYSQYQLNKLNGADPVQEELKKLNGKISEMEKSAQDNLNKQFEAAVQERRIATQELVDKSTDYPRIKKANAHEAVVQHILDTWEHDQQELSIEQAAKEVEEILVEKAKQWAALVEEQKPEPPIEEKKPLPPLKQGLKTLTNQVTTGDFKRPQKPLSHMNDAERWAEARRRAEEKLHSRGR